MAKILIVDDEKAFLRSLVIGLSEVSKDYELLIASNGAEALDILDKVKVDLVLTDLRMPEIGGFELVAYMSRQHPDVPIILMTAYGTPELESNFRVLGIYHYLEKPIDFGELEGAIARALSDKTKTIVESRQIRSRRDLIEILYSAKESGTSGELIVATGEGRGRIFILGGQVAWVSVSNGDLGFLPFLVEQESMSRTALREAFDESRASGKNFLDTLIATTDLTKERLREGLLHHFARVMLEVLSWRAADVSFHTKEWRYSGPVTVDLDDVLTQVKSLGARHVSGLDIRLSTMHQKVRDKSLKLQEVLGELRDITGFLGAGVFLPSGLSIAKVEEGTFDVQSLGHVSCHLMDAVKAATERLDTGPSSMVYISGGKVDLLIAAANTRPDVDENEDECGGTLMTIMAMEQGGNLGMAKLLLGRVSQRVGATYC